MKRLILLTLMLFLSIVAVTAQKVPDNCIPGVFSVSADKKVYFSKGNLQYQPCSNTWRFAEQQYTLLDDNPEGHTTMSYTATSTDWIDLFGWGMWLDEITDKAMITEISTTSKKYAPELTDDSEFANNHRTIDGEQWQTLSRDEYVYLIDTRATTTGIRYSKAKVHGLKGLVLLPDAWDGSYTFANSNTSDASFEEITNDDWSTLELEGAVFLPAAGSRYENSVNLVGSYGYYWSSTANSKPGAYFLSFVYYSNVFQSYVHPTSFDFRFLGHSVRLVRCL